MITRECFVNLTEDNQLYEIAKASYERVGEEFTKSRDCFTDQTIDNQLYDIIDFCGDSDARTYIANVENQEGEPLEEPVKRAYCNLFRSLKREGIWDAIKSSCAMCGARTIDGCLIPIKGNDPIINGSPFPTADYNRKTGLLSDGTRYLDTDNQIRDHLSIYLSSFTRPTGDIDNKTYIGARPLTGATSEISRRVDDTKLTIRGIDYFSPVSPAAELGFLGVTRIGSSTIIARINGNSILESGPSAPSPAINVFVFARNDTPFQAGSIANARIAFYSNGSALTQQQIESLDSIVSNFISEINLAIP
jgi:hypothetical protein